MWTLCIFLLQLIYLSLIIQLLFSIDSFARYSICHYDLFNDNNTFNESFIESSFSNFFYYRDSLNQTIFSDRMALDSHFYSIGNIAISSSIIRSFRENIPLFSSKLSDWDFWEDFSRLAQWYDFSVQVPPLVVRDKCGRFPT